MQTGILWLFFFFFSSRRRHTRCSRDWSSDVCSSDLVTYNVCLELTGLDTENILVVDDEEAIREVVSTMLESKGYRCTVAHNGRVAQEHIKRTTPDLILSDMIMPEMDGIKLLEWVREFDPDVPVIMVTAIHDISTALEAIRRGAYDYILKPFEKDQLFLGVGRALQHRRLVNENRKYQRDLEQQVEDRTARLQEALDQLEQSYDDTLEALGSALDLKDAETEGHCQRVTAFCISVAKTMPVPDTYLPILARAAFLHDIGKMAIPESEEHTSELQSRLHLVCRLLLEKKKPF